MDKILIVKFIQIISIVLLIIVILMMIKTSKTIRKSKRITEFTLKNKEDNNLSIGDEILNYFLKQKEKISNIVKKSSYFNKASKRYDKYVHGRNTALNIISTKYIVSLITAFIYLLSCLFTYRFDVIVLIIFMIVGYYLYDIYLHYHEKQRNKLIEADLLKAIIIMNNAFKSGYNITQAINIVVKDLTGPISEEFNRIGEDLKYGLELKDVFERFYQRVEIEDTKYITSSLSLLNLTGGNLVGIFSSIETSFTNKKRLKDELNAMTSSSELVYRILLFIPFVLIALLLVFNSSFFSPLISSLVGYIIIIIAISIYIVYIYIIKKILRVDV